jgi:hypothetical protein
MRCAPRQASSTLRSRFGNNQLALGVPNHVDQLLVRGIGCGWVPCRCQARRLGRGAGMCARQPLNVAAVAHGEVDGAASLWCSTLAQCWRFISRCLPQTDLNQRIMPRKVDVQ